MPEAKVSVIIPVYNVEEYLVRCLDSVTQQTLEDIEIICINDGSTDNSYEILKKYAQKDKRIHVIDKNNEGQGIARNLGIQYARSEYISFVDPDDEIHPDMLKCMYEQARKLNSEIVICDLLKIQEWSGKVFRHHFFQKAKSAVKLTPVDLQPGINLAKDEFLQTLLVSACYSVNRVYKTEFLKSNNIQFSLERCFEDVIFILKSHTLAEKISYIDRPFYHYHLRQTSTLRNLSKIHTILLETLEEIQNYLTENGLTGNLRDNFANFAAMNTIWTCPKLSTAEKNFLLANVRKYLSSSDYHLLQKELKFGFKAITQRIFSVTNRDNHKIFNVFGIKIKVKHIKGELKKEKYYIKELKRNYLKFPNDSYLLFDCLHDNTVECIDAYSLFLEMRRQNLNAYYVILKDTPLYRQLAAGHNLENIIPLENSSKEFPGEFVQTIYPFLLRTKAIITSFGENSKKIGLFFKDFPHWQYIFIQHGTIFLKESIMYNGYLFPDKFDKVLICSEQEKKIFNKYGWGDEKLIKCGLPRWDLLKPAGEMEKSILVMFTWRKLDILHFETSLYRQNILNLLTNKELHGLLEDNNITLYFAHHHALAKNNGIDFQVEGSANVKIIDNTEISKYIRKTSCLITDFSSVAFDFMFQNKPVLFYLLDAYEKNLNKNDAKDLQRLEYKQFILPNVLYSQEEVINRLKFYIQNNFTIEQETKAQYDKFFYTKTDICKQLIKEIQNLC